MKAIITGATGSIGMALIDKLLKENVSILVIARKNSERLKNIPNNVNIIYSDLEHLCDIENDSNEEYDVFYHFAWSGTTGAFRNDLYLQNNNVKYTLDAVRLASKFKCKLFIGAGSQAEYGLSSENLSASTFTKPFTGYGMAKLAAGLMSRKLCHDLGMKHIWTRILSVYGPYDSSCSLIMSILKNVYEGKEIDVTKGEQQWDFIYSADVAEIMYLLSSKGIDGKTYVIGSGQTKTIREYIEIIIKTIGVEAKVNYGAIPYGENQIMYLCADNIELLSDISYTIKYDFMAGISELIKWYKDNILR